MCWYGGYGEAVEGPDADSEELGALRIALWRTQKSVSPRKCQEGPIGTGQKSGNRRGPNVGDRTEGQEVGNLYGECFRNSRTRYTFVPRIRNSLLSVQVGYPTRSHDPERERGPSAAVRAPS